MSEDQKQQLEQALWAVSNVLRGRISADEYRDYILGLVFYKYLSGKLLTLANELLEEDEIKDYALLNMAEHKDTVDAIKEEIFDDLGYFLEPQQLIEHITAKGLGKLAGHATDIIVDLDEAFRAIENSTLGTSSEDDFQGLFDEVDLHSSKLGKTHNDRNKVIVNMLAELNEIKFNLHEADGDLLGDAYEYLIARFASGAGKTAGEFYTPRTVSTLLAKLASQNRVQVKNAYDPTCGSGSLLLRIGKELKVGSFFGQELNRTTYNLARMNMLMHNIHFNEFDIKHDDTLIKPQHLGMKFDAIVANPPFSAMWSADPLLLSTDNRYAPYGKLAPKTKADFAFIQHMISHLSEEGAMAVVVPHGVLFRGAAEGHIRRFIIEQKNYLDAVIGLPANLFYGTGIPTSVLVFKKCRQHNDNVIFIDASQAFNKGKNQNDITELHIQDIVDTYYNREVKDKYSYVASMQEIADNDYNLNIPRYVDTFEEEEEIDLMAVRAERKMLDAEMQSLEREMSAYLKELGYDA